MFQKQVVVSYVLVLCIYCATLSISYPVEESLDSKNVEKRQVKPDPVTGFQPVGEVDSLPLPPRFPPGFTKKREVKPDPVTGFQPVGEVGFDLPPRFPPGFMDKRQIESDFGDFESFSSDFMDDMREVDEKRQIKPDPVTGFVPIGEYGDLPPRYPPGLRKKKNISEEEMDD